MDQWENACKAARKRHEAHGRGHPKSCSIRKQITGKEAFSQVTSQIQIRTVCEASRRNPPPISPARRRPRRDRPRSSGWHNFALEGQTNRNSVTSALPSAKGLSSGAHLETIQTDFGFASRTARQWCYYVCAGMTRTARHHAKAQSEGSRRSSRSLQVTIEPKRDLADMLIPWNLVRRTRRKKSYAIGCCTDAGMPCFGVHRQAQEFARPMDKSGPRDPAGPLW